MSFVRRIKYFLVHGNACSNKEADELLRSGKVKINGEPVFENKMLGDDDEVSIENRIIRKRKIHSYLKFYKPTGFQSTLNATVESSLCDFFKEVEGLAIAGRLDKASEGLLLLSTDGKWIERVVNPKAEKEKEYVVELDKAPDDRFFREMSAGVMLGDGPTRPCFCERAGEKQIRVVLTEGRNRQIRRMCRKLGYEVTRLVRIRIDHIELKGLTPGEWQFFTI